MFLACGYNIHRYVHRNNRARKLTHSEFKRAIISGLLSHIIVAVPPNIQGRPQRTHTLQQTDPGSHDRNPRSRRRFVASCRNCPNLDANGNRNTNRQTSYFCVECNVHLHPECFDIYHNIRTSPVHVVRCPPGTRGPQHDPANRRGNRRNLRNNMETEL